MHLMEIVANGRAQARATLYIVQLLRHKNNARQSTDQTVRLHQEKQPIRAMCKHNHKSPKITPIPNTKRENQPKKKTIERSKRYAESAIFIIVIDVTPFSASKYRY